MGRMSIAADTFAEFVDGLADALDDHDVSGEDWAARHHFSRFHFDRMIKSVGGEPPQALRRRILLERAAYRMITTKAPLIDIAVEAGYSSHEAFTRAFTKAYGAPPREWRTKPGHIQIGEPVAVHFVPPGSIRLPVARHREGAGPAGEDGRAPRLADRRDGADRGPADRRPARRDGRWSRSTTTSRRCARCSAGWSGRWACGTPRWRPATTTGASRTTSRSAPLRRRLDIEGPRYLAHVREVCDQGRLDDTFVDALCEPAEVFTYGGMVAHVLTFAAYRRTLVVMALARHGHDELGWGDPMRWVAGEH